MLAVADVSLEKQMLARYLVVVLCVNSEQTLGGRCWLVAVIVAWLIKVPSCFDSKQLYTYILKSSDQMLLCSSFPRQLKESCCWLLYSFILCISVLRQGDTPQSLFLQSLTVWQHRDQLCQPGANNTLSLRLYFLLESGCVAVQSHHQSAISEGWQPSSKQGQPTCCCLLTLTAWVVERRGERVRRLVSATPCATGRNNKI